MDLSHGWMFYHLSVQIFKGPFAKGSQLEGYRFEGCGWSCGKDMHCLTNHSKTCYSLIDDVPYDLVQPTGVGLDQQGMHSLSCWLDLNWHVGCIGKLARSKKVKAGKSAPKVITDDEKWRLRCLLWSGWPVRGMVVTPEGSVLI